MHKKTPTTAGDMHIVKFKEFTLVSLIALKIDIAADTNSNTKPITNILGMFSFQ